MQIAGHKLTRVANANWSTEARSRDPPPEFKPEVVKSIYNHELGGATGTPPNLRVVMMLEISQYLENYLWPHFDPKESSYEHVMSILIMVNEKFRENVPAFGSFSSRQDVFPAFCKVVLPPQVPL